ncbi:hypothetical protein OAE41_00225, partial [bacterium]|nr:hypothetical protein [bacterium]
LYQFNPIHTINHKISNKLVRYIGIYVLVVGIYSFFKTYNLLGSRAELLSLYSATNAWSQVFPLFFSSTCFLLLSNNPKPPISIYLFAFLPFTFYDFCFQSRSFLVLSLVSLILALSRRKVNLNRTFVVFFIPFFAILMRLIEIIRSPWLSYQLSNSPFSTLFVLPGEFINSYFAILLINQRYQINPFNILAQNMFFFLPQRIRSLFIPDLSVTSDFIDSASDVISWGLGGNLLVEFFHSSSIIYIYLGPVFMVIFLVSAKYLYTLNFFSEAFYVICMIYSFKFFRAGFIASIFECLYYLTIFIAVYFGYKFIFNSNYSRGML